mmetsp:Transcript_53559/g.148933  ORF Transcript_53559/g.148933 Transcript_53559/m.148933 type:complete len:207 (-) Transcript_53559:581-1201(-)
MPCPCPRRATSFGMLFGAPHGRRPPPNGPRRERMHCSAPSQRCGPTWCHPITPLTTCLANRRRYHLCWRWAPEAPPGRQQEVEAQEGNLTPQPPGLAAAAVTASSTWPRGSSTHIAGSRPRRRNHGCLAAGLGNSAPPSTNNPCHSTRPRVTPQPWLRQPRSPTPFFQGVPKQKSSPGSSRCWAPSPSCSTSQRPQSALAGRRRAR